MAESKSKSKLVTKKKGAKKRSGMKPKTNVKTDSAVERQSQRMSGQQTAVETGQVESGVKRNVVSWIALLFSGLAVGGVVWYLTAVENVGQQEIRFNTRLNMIAQRVDEFDVTQSDNNNAVKQLQNQLAQMTQAQGDFSNQIKTIQNEFQNKLNKFIEQKSVAEQDINTQADDFRQKLNRLSDSIAKLRAEQGRDTDSRTLEQVEQLILMANQQVQFGGQLVGGRNLARRALQDADVLLQKVDVAINQQVRQLLSAEMTALDKVKVVDVVGVLNTLSALSSTVEHLALAGDIVIAEKTDAEIVAKASAAQAERVAEAEASGMRYYVQPIIDAGASLLSGIGELIQVEKNGKSVKPIISAAVRQMTYQRTKLILESAQIAFIRQQPDLYRNRIQAARSWVKENFDQQADETADWLAQLDAVGSISPQSKLPDISASLKAIRNIIENSSQDSVGIKPNKAE